MNTGNIEGVILTPLEIINVPGGDVLHAMKRSDPGYCGFGEAYFSTIEPGVVKAWKRHREMVLNIVVPVGKIRFVLFDDRNVANSNGCFQVVELSTRNYCRLTVPPMVWFGFVGCGDHSSILLNIASIPHVKEECDRRPVNDIVFDWGC